MVEEVFVDEDEYEPEVYESKFKEDLVEAKVWLDKVKDNLPYTDKSGIRIDTLEYMYTLLLTRVACSQNRIKDYLDKYGPINVYNLGAQDRAVANIMEDALDEIIEFMPDIDIDLDEKEMKQIRKNSRNRILKNLERLIFEGYPNGGKKNGKKVEKVERKVTTDDEPKAKKTRKAKTKTEESDEAKPKRKRRTKAEMEAARAAGTEKPKKPRKTAKK